MEYPIFELPMLGGGMLIAGMAIFHVFIAQFSIGAAFLVALAERRAIRDGDADTRRLLRQYARMILLVPYVLGTMTGVGIWLAISVVNPRAPSALIHLFVWAWVAAGAPASTVVAAAQRREGRPGGGGSAARGSAWRRLVSRASLR